MAAMVFLPTVFGTLHRYGCFDLLVAVWLLLVAWAVSSFVGAPLEHPRAWLNLCLWGVLAMVLLQVLPMPLVDGVGRTPAIGPLAGVMTDQTIEAGPARNIALPVGRYSLRTAATVGTVVILAGASGLYWLTASAVTGRRRLRWTTWAVLAGAALLAYSGVLADFDSTSRSAEGVARLRGPVTVLGGDSLVPALLAALPLTLAVVLRTLGRMPRRAPHQRESRWGWLNRVAFIGPFVALPLTAVIAAALGMSNVPRPILAVCVTLSAGFVLVGYLLAGPGPKEQRRAVLIALALAVLVLASVWVGSEAGRERQPAAGAAGRIAALIDAMPTERTLFGIGAGGISPRAVFGLPGWPAAPGDDRDTDGYLVLWAELGCVGIGLVALTVVAAALFMVRTWRRSRGPWPRTAAMVGLGALAANLVYFRDDAVALLVPNLLVLAAVFGVVAAWAGQGTLWRSSPMWPRGRSSWPLFAGALGLLAVLGLAENEMLSASSEAPEVSDKFLHFGTFAVLTLLLCASLARRSGGGRLAAPAALAVLAMVTMGVLLEYAQRYLTHGRAFEIDDMLASAGGSFLMGVGWWLMRRSQSPLAPGELPPA
jgi:VanZ family protein/energy-converting hydrogenase Eha subunit A